MLIITLILCEVNFIIMKTGFILFVVLLSQLQFGNCFILEGLIIKGFVISVAFLSYHFRCNFYECCNEEQVPQNTTKLKLDLQSKLYGQHIAGKIVYSSVYGHINHENPRKPLVLSFHGLPGSGKNYVASMIAKALFKNGEKSKYYYFYNGRSVFPSDSKVDEYKLKLTKEIEHALNKCEKSLFVFDEVDKIPPGVLDALVPFLSYASTGNDPKSKSIFIFLSNTGRSKIVNRMIDLWKSGKSREDVTLQDFEVLLALSAYNEIGGFYQSDTIESKVIDYHIPFLPLEQKQVIQCIKDEFQRQGEENPTDDMINRTLSHITFGPPSYNVYSTGGCKRLDYKVSLELYGGEFDD